VHRNEKRSAILPTRRHHVEIAIVADERQVAREVAVLAWMHVVDAVRLPLAALDLKRRVIVRIDPIADEIRIPTDR
jgi:hypothetical protein